MGTGQGELGYTPKNMVSMLKRNRRAAWSLSIFSPAAMTSMAEREAFWWSKMPSST